VPSLLTYIPGGLIAGLTGGKAGPPPYPVDDQLGALLVRSLEACAAETTAAYAAAEAAASAALDNPAQAPAPVAAGPNVMPQGAQDVVEVLGYLAQLSGTQGGRGLGDLSRDRLRQCLEAHVVPALWRGDVDSEVRNGNPLCLDWDMHVLLFVLHLYVSPC
jgi:hypothetical protein